MFDFDKELINANRGVFDADLNLITIKVMSHSDVKSVVSTLVHESHHQRTYFRTNNRDIANIYEEYKAFRREHYFNEALRPTLAQRQIIWDNIYEQYSILPQYQDMLGNVKLGLDGKDVPKFLSSKKYILGE